MQVTIMLRSGELLDIEIADELRALPEPARRAWEEADRAQS